MKKTKTITRIFIAPTLFDRKDEERVRKQMTENGLVNVFIKDKGREVQYDNCVYFLYKPDDMDRFRDFLEEEYERTSAVIDDYDYEGGYVVVVYQLSPVWLEDYELIKQSLYSKTSKEFQDLFPRVVHITDAVGLRKDTLSLPFRVFNKTQDLVDELEKEFGVHISSKQEMWHKFEEEFETLDIEKIRQHVQQGSL